MPKFDDERIFMNTRIRITVLSNEGTVQTRNKIAQAFAQFDYVMEKYTRFDKKSELSKLNADMGKWHTVSRELFDLVKYVLDLADKTKGTFDPTIIDVLEAYGFTNENKFQNLQNPGLYQEINGVMKSRPSYNEIAMDRKKLRIKLRPGQRIDLGSTGKGYAIDLAYRTLDGFPSFIINAGGDIRAKGLNTSGKPWKIALYKTQLPNQRITNNYFLGFIDLNNASIASSGGWARKVGFFHHLVNAKTGLPENISAQSYVIGKTAYESDAWATILFLTGQTGLQLLEKNGLQGLVIFENGQIFKTPGFVYYEKTKTNI
ncbi:MAG TPA: FAD:protein FMN transferase [Candidatus Dojkabacteria bacterium]|nr:FAD:protein FMN transferase [Candidatus Dojkabacteria bacterium]